MKSTYITHSPEETKQVAAELATTLKGGEYVALLGDLGSGKTTFVQGLAKALNAKAKVKSPTFTIMNIYPVEQRNKETEKQKNIQQIVHIDYYRVQDEGAEIGLEEYRTPQTVVVAEWPVDLTNIENLITVQISGGGAMTDRSINIQREADVGGGI